MKICILNGNPAEENTAFEEYISSLETNLGKRAHQVSLLQLRDLDLKNCMGCWNCWLATPGMCHVSDASRFISKEYISSDLVVFASPVLMGFSSALLKKANDKLVQVLHPYIEFIDGESHHQKRYEKYPQTGLLLEKTPGTDPEDIEIITDIYKRDAINLRTKLSFSELTTTPVKQICDAIDNI